MIPDLDPPRGIVLGWKPLFAAQRAMIANDAGIDIGVAGVGAGKSQSAGAKMLMWPLRHPRRKNGTPTEGVIIGKDYRMIRANQFEEVLAKARDMWTWDEQARALVPFPYEAVITKVVGGDEPRIEFSNGTKLHGFSSTTLDRMRSFQFDYTWIDESEFQPREAITMGLNRMRGADPIRMVITSSPAGASEGWLWAIISGKFPEWDELRRSTPIRVHRFTSADNPTLSPATLATIRAAMNAQRPGLATQELDGKFLGTEEAPLQGAFDWSRAFAGRLQLSREESKPVVLGVDLGAKHDWTVLVVMSAAGVVLELERFKESTVAIAEESFFPYVESRIISMLAKHGIPLVVMDTAWTGASLAQFLGQKLGDRAQVLGFKTDQQGKRDQLIEELGSAMSSGRVRIPTQWTGADGAEHQVDNHELFRLECVKLLVEHVGLKRHFKHPQGGHDDIIVATALAFHGLVTSAPGAQLADLSKLLERPSDGPAAPGPSWGSTFGGSSSSGGGYNF